MRRFPYTRPWGEALRGFLLERLAVFARDIINALPDLFTVLLIALLTRMVGRAMGLVFNAVEEGRATMPGVHPETAASTRRLVNGLLWLFALALAYPYLPGSDTDAFKGVSVFVGLIVSLGSSGIVTQMMSGITLTYSRALRRQRLRPHRRYRGHGHLPWQPSAKIQTLRNEEVTIPNAVVVGNQIINYSRLAGSEGVYVGTTVTIGYDVPWRQVQALLLQAAGRTDGVRSTPPPRVRQSGLRDFYVEYLLLVALEDPTLRLPTLDRLHGHILDGFNEHGVQIMSPSYEADPEGKKIVPPDKWFASPASPPAAAAALIGRGEPRLIAVRAGPAGSPPAAVTSPAAPIRRAACRRPRSRSRCRARPRRGRAAAAWRTRRRRGRPSPSVLAIVASSTTSVSPSLHSSSWSPSSRVSRSTSTCDLLVRPAQHVGEDVPQARAGRLAGGELPGVDEQLHVGVVFGEAMQRAGAQQVGARVADVDDEQLPAEAPGGGQRRSHAAERLVLAAALDHVGADLLYRLAGAPLESRACAPHPPSRSSRARPGPG